MLTLSMALFLGASPDPVAPAVEITRVAGRRDLVWPGMAQEQVKDLLGEDGRFVCAGTAPGFVIITRDYPRSRVTVTFSNDGVGGTDIRVTEFRMR